MKFPQLPFVRGICNAFLSRLRGMGNIPVCNARKQTGVHIGGFCFPVCSRCLAIIISLFFTRACGGMIFVSPINVYVGFLLLLPCVFNGLVSYGIAFGEGTSNVHRIWTGSCAGVGLAILAG